MVWATPDDQIAIEDIIIGVSDANDVPPVFAANSAPTVLVERVEIPLNAAGQTLTINFDHTETVASYDSSIFLAGVILRDFTFLDDFFVGLSAFTIASQADLPSGVDII